MFRVEEYLSELIASMKNVFGDRLLYVGLQGSYLREEATEDSDLDIMVILKDLSVQDMKLYREIILQMQDYEKSCGFICGMDEFRAWNPLELCHLLHSTKDYYGKLSVLIPEYSKEDIANFIKLGIGNLYHEICHRYIHSDREANYQKLPLTYKGVFFTLQNMYYLKNGVFCVTQKDLIDMLETRDKEIMEISLSIANVEEYDFDKAFSKLFLWCKSVLTELKVEE
ncbi:MAG: nucleotidyltransferase domain-containing protein [Lachnospiraceae bacterium]|nr:nucleotidyltransferase domain-containing protein [Lachnospiraceae bacterium]